MVTIRGLSWTEEAEEHIALHHVTVEEVEEAVFDHRLYWRRAKNDYRKAIGQTAGGRYLTVILDDEGGGFWYPVTARNATQSERRLLKKEKAGRRG